MSAEMSKGPVFCPRKRVCLGQDTNYDSLMSDQ